MLAVQLNCLSSGSPACHFLSHEHPVCEGDSISNGELFEVVKVPYFHCLKFSRGTSLLVTGFTRQVEEVKIKLLLVCVFLNVISYQT